MKNEESRGVNKQKFINEYEKCQEKVPELKAKLELLLKDYEIIFSELYQFLFANFRKYGIYSGNYPLFDFNTQELLLRKPVSEGQII